MTSPGSVFKIYNNSQQFFFSRKNVVTCLKTLVVDKWIAYTKKLPRVELSCISIDWDTTLNVIVLWQIVTSPVSIFELYNSQ